MVAAELEVVGMADCTLVALERASGLALAGIEDIAVELEADSPA